VSRPEPVNCFTISRIHVARLIKTMTILYTSQTWNVRLISGIVHPVIYVLSYTLWYLGAHFNTFDKRKPRQSDIQILVQTNAYPSREIVVSHFVRVRSFVFVGVIRMHHRHESRLVRGDLFILCESKFDRCVRARANSNLSDRTGTLR
jgi:hypothetical protein